MVLGFQEMVNNDFRAWLSSKMQVQTWIIGCPNADAHTSEDRPLRPRAAQTMPCGVSTVKRGCTRWVAMIQVYWYWMVLVDLIISYNHNQNMQYIFEHDTGFPTSLATFHCGTLGWQNVHRWSTVDFTLHPQALQLTGRSPSLVAALPSVLFHQENVWQVTEPQRYWKLSMMGANWMCLTCLYQYHTFTILDLLHKDAGKNTLILAGLVPNESGHKKASQLI